MTHFLRHTAVCLWLALLPTAAAGLWLLPALQALVGPEAIPFIAAGALAAAFMGVGWLTTKLGLGRVKRRLQAAAQAEREGMAAEAEAELRAALVVLDRFWVSASARRRSTLIIAARLTRLYLAHEQLAPDGPAFVDAYLTQFPADAEAAEGWAALAEQHGGLRDAQQELAGRLTRRYPENAVIARAAARLFLRLERTDYEALQCYRRAADTSSGAPDELRTDLARMLGRAGIPAGEPPRPVAPAAVVPAAALPVRPSRKAETVSERPSPPPGPSDLEDVERPFRMTTAREDVEEEEEPSGPVRPRPATESVFWRNAAAWTAALGAALTLGQRAAAARLPGIAAGARSLCRTAAVRRVLGAAAIAGLGAVLVWLVATAMDDYFNRPSGTPAATAEAPAGEPQPEVTDDPYTLQVAAYIRQEGALKLVDDLKRRGLDAYSTETASGGKVFYQVRISHFPDQQSARDFGRSLKAKGLIEDFYVTNYVR